MGSRIREDPGKLYEVFVEISKPSSKDDSAVILQQYPPEFNDQEVLHSLPKFAFPCDYESPAVDHFTFVLTDIESKYKFGFCRHAQGAQTCLCIVSFLPWYEIFYKLLNVIAELINYTDKGDPIPLLQEIYSRPVPEASQYIEIVDNGNHKFTFTSPNLNKLPTIPENRNLTEYYNAVDPMNMMVIFASMLYERRILITSKKLSRLTACVHGSASLIYPMHWQHLYIPVLPAHLIDYCSAPMPFLIGIHSSLLQKALTMELGDVIILDADLNEVQSEYDDLQTLPHDIVSVLKKRLKGNKHQTVLMGDMVAMAFLRSLVGLIGGYRDALRFRQGEEIKFEPEMFIRSRSASMKPFLEKMLQLQIFQQFIEERLQLLNEGHGFNDEFERETTIWADKSGTNSMYKEWLTSMKKKGTKFKRDGRDIWKEFSDKVKDKSKKAYKDFKLKLDELTKEEENSVTNKRHTIHGGLLVQKRPPRPPLPTVVREQDLANSAARRVSYERARHYDIIDTADFEAPRPMTSLLNDPDIQTALKKSHSMEDLLVSDSEDEKVKESMPSVRRSSTLHTSASSEAIMDTAQATTPMAPVPKPRKKRQKNNASNSPVSSSSTNASPNTTDTNSEHLLIDLDTDSLKGINQNTSGTELHKYQSKQTFEDNFVPVTENSNPRTDIETTGFTLGGDKMEPALQNAPQVVYKLGYTDSNVIKQQNSGLKRREAFRQDVIRSGIVGPPEEVDEDDIDKYSMPNQNSLDIFDPLADMTKKHGSSGSTSCDSKLSSEENDLLKDWNLDFSGFNITTSGASHSDTCLSKETSWSNPGTATSVTSAWNQPQPNAAGNRPTGIYSSSTDQRRLSSLITAKPFVAQVGQPVVSHVVAPSMYVTAPQATSASRLPSSQSEFVNTLNNVPYMARPPPSLSNSIPRPWTSFQSDNNSFINQTTTNRESSDGAFQPGSILQPSVRGNTAVDDPFADLVDLTVTSSPMISPTQPIKNVVESNHVARNSWEKFD